MADEALDRSEQCSALLDEWVEVRGRIARLEAEASALLAARIRLCEADAADSPHHREGVRRSMFAEFSAAGRVATGTIERAFIDALFVEDHHPTVRESFAAGDISAAHVRQIVEAGAIVREAVCNGRAAPSALALYDAAALVVAENDTPARTRAHVREIAAALAGETVVERHRRARSERSVTIRPVDDGLALLMVVLPEHLAEAILDRLTRMAHEVIATRDEREVVLDPLEPDDQGRSDDRIEWRDLDDGAIFGEGITFTTDPTLACDPDAFVEDSDAERELIDPLLDPVNSPDVEHLPGDLRTIDQVRADLLADLLLAACPSEVHGAALDSIQARIQVTVSASTLAGVDDRPAQLDGRGPLLPEVARDLAGRNSGWARLFLDAAGMVVETDSYTPTEQMKRFLRARDQHCRFPGCRMPVHRCQIDHNLDHAKGGRTSVDNLSHVCIRHHSLKHPDVDARHRWTASQRSDGTIDWFSPLGRHYSDPPPRRVSFV